jgi:acyl carrier protein
MDILKTVTEIVADVLDLDIENINPASTQQSFEEWDSLATIQIINSVGDDFDIEIGVNDIECFSSIESIIQFVNSKK